MVAGWGIGQLLLAHLMATWPSGKARVCKTLTTGSNPVVASVCEDQMISAEIYSAVTFRVPFGVTPTGHFV
jgi:hypothetical protein